MQEPFIQKKRSWKFWLGFWIFAFVFLAGWTIIVFYRSSGVSGLLRLARPLVAVAPTSQERKNELRTIFDILPEVTNGTQERTYLVLFQNNMELRPGGGFIGSFGIIKTKGEQVTFIDTHDTNVFDSGKETKIPAPYPMKETLKIDDWEFRDSNWSADYPTNAQKAMEMYHLEGGQEQFDGVVAISTELLTTFLSITGPITIDGYPGEFNSENAISKLEYQVEKGFAEQGIDRGQRKYIMKDMAKVLIERAQNLNWSQKKELLLAIERHMNQKDVMVYFTDQSLQQKISIIGWSGEMRQARSDYFMIVDANLGALKSDIHIKRSFRYFIDFSKPKPQATLEITYQHTARARDWMTTDYLTYLRVYVPEGSWLGQAENVGEQTYGSEFGKKYFGSLIRVPIGQEKTVRFTYDLPETISFDTYDLMVQKQSGVGVVPGKITVTDRNGANREYSIKLTRDWNLDEQVP